MSQSHENLTQVITPSRSSTWWLVIVVVGLFATQAVTRSLSIDGKPGAERDDAVFIADTLPRNIAAWEYRQFFPAVNSEINDSGQFWTTHAWTYQLKDHSCIVAFDQLGLHEWHELTVCYEGRGWDITDRVIRTPQDDSSGWPYVVARMRNADGRCGLVVFSVFWGSGEPMAAPSDRLAVSFTGRDDAHGGLLSRITGRIQGAAVSGDVRPGLENRGLQCQVFLTSFDALSSEQVDSIVMLHRVTREKFRTAWLAHAAVPY
jgi:hypothetical protein